MYVKGNDRVRAGGRKKDFKDPIFVLAEQSYTVKTSDRFQMNPKKCLCNTALLA